MTPPLCVIAGRKIGPGQPPFVVAELSSNHNGDLDRALEIMATAKEAGADAVKLQTYTADTLTIDHAGPNFTIEGGPWAGRTLYDLYREAHTPWDWHQRLFERGRELGITVFSSPFDATAVDFLQELGAPAYKIASFECIDLALIRKVAATGKPVIMSTGMADGDEIGEAVATARQAGCRELALLHCVSAYPAEAADSNLRIIPRLAEDFGVVVGLSDHTIGTTVATAAVALGAAIIEKHVTLKRTDGGPDAAFSLEPKELAELCAAARTTWEALGDGAPRRMPSEEGSLVFRRSLYVVADIARGDLLSEKNVRSIRPGHGLKPKHLPDILGRPAARDLKRGEALQWDMVEGGQPS